MAVVDGETLALFKNTNAQEIRLTALETPGDCGSHFWLRRSAFERIPPGQRHSDRRRFRHGLAEVLNKWTVKNKIDELLVIAAPKTHGELRKHRHKDLESKLAGEIAKDLMGHSSDQIAAAIKKA